MPVVVSIHTMRRHNLWPFLMLQSGGIWAFQPRAIDTAHPTIPPTWPRSIRREVLWRTSAYSRSTTTNLWASSAPNLESNDPFLILGMEQPTSDLKEIKRAYKRAALKYHPDVVVTSTSTPQDKKEASDRFAKINWAYQILNGKMEDSKTTARSSSSSTTKTDDAWKPPHRRPAASPNADRWSVDWQDFMPKYNEEDYKADGDSFGSIFSDLLSGAATAAAGGGRGIFRDFVEFLEKNVDGYSNDDAELRLLLHTGSIQDVGDEMDDTELVVQQLSAKLLSVEQELVTVTADARLATRFSEKIALQERADELKARRDVVNGYIQKARKRLLALQTRYKELIVRGQNDLKAGGRIRTNGNSESRSHKSSYGTQQDTSSSTNASPRRRHEGANDAWKDDTFGSFGRGRGSSRRRSRRDADSEKSSSFSSSSNSPNGSRREEVSPDKSTSTVPTDRSNAPPHRRTIAQERDDNRKLRELKVKEEFDKLKKELGL